MHDGRAFLNGEKPQALSARGFSSYGPSRLNQSHRRLEFSDNGSIVNFGERAERQA